MLEDDTPATFHVLFLCTGNSARSILAEAILERIGTPRFRAFSAGSHPKDAPHPMALATLARAGVATRGLRSKSWEEFAGPAAPRLDLVVTVCDQAAGESCPIWPGHPLTAHWGVPDPASFEGSEAETAAFFQAVHDRLAAKIAALVRLEPRSLDADELAARIEAIGRR